jgi:hypothetical protein
MNFKKEKFAWLYFFSAFIFAMALGYELHWVIQMIFGVPFIFLFVYLHLIPSSKPELDRYCSPLFPFI